MVTFCVGLNTSRAQVVTIIILHKRVSFDFASIFSTMNASSNNHYMSAVWQNDFCQRVMAPKPIVRGCEGGGGKPVQNAKNLEKGFWPRLAASVPENSCRKTSGTFMK